MPVVSITLFPTHIMQITTTLVTETSNGKERITQTFQGTLQQQGEFMLLSYDDPELGATRLFIHPDRVKLVRKGAFTTQMIFLPNVTTHSEYHSPGGVFDLAIQTTFFNLSPTLPDRQLELHYNLSINGEEAAQNQLTVIF